MDLTTGFSSEVGSLWHRARCCFMPWLDNLLMKRTTNGFWLGRGLTGPTSMGILFEGGGDKKLNFFVFSADVIFKKGMKLHIIAFLCPFLCGKQHLVSGINCFCKP